MSVGVSRRYRQKKVPMVKTKIDLIKSDGWLDKNINRIPVAVQYDNTQKTVEN